MTKLKTQKAIYYVTGNESKFKTAKNYFETLGVKVLQKTLEIPEIQSDSIEEIATFAPLTRNDRWILDKPG